MWIFPAALTYPDLSHEIPAEALMMQAHNNIHELLD